jgi:hypothetical protein
MTTSTDPALPAPASDTPPPPLDNAITFVINKEINLTQLTDEISKAANTTVQVAVSMSAEGDPTQPYSEGNPGTLYVTPATVDKAKVQAVIDAHVVNSNYSVPQVEQDFAAITELVLTDPTTVLSEDQIQQALRGLIARATAPAVPGQLLP